MITNLLFLLGYFVLSFLTIVSHEYGHYLSYAYYGGNPKFGLKKKGTGIKTQIIPFITPLKADAFYKELFEKDTKTAWVKQIILSGSGLIQTLVFAIVFISLSSYSAIFFFVGILNAVTFLLNFKSESSDGYKIIMALHERENFVNHLNETKYSFTPESFREDIEKIQALYSLNN